MVVCVTGVSGSGKTSLVKAGVIPKLRGTSLGDSWVYVDFSVGQRPNYEFARALMASSKPVSSEENSGSGIDVMRLADEFTDDPNALDMICKKLLDGRPDWARILIFVDHFEELFTQANEAERIRFIDLLSRMMLSNFMGVILALRADFYAQSISHREIAKLFELGIYPLADPDKAELYEMIMRPAKRAQMQFEPGVVEQMVQDFGTGPGGLPLLQYALQNMYSISKDGGVFTYIHYVYPDRVTDDQIKLEIYKVFTTQ